MTTGALGIGAVTYSETSGGTNCVIVGDKLRKATPGTCRIRAVKAGVDSSNVQFSQTVVFTFHGATAQDPLSISASSPTSGLGNTITLSTSGGSGDGGVTYAITGPPGSGTITGNILSAIAAGTFTVVATKQGDTQYAPAVSLPVTLTFTP
jgi:hypothetical protein